MITLVAFGGYHKTPKGGQPVQQLPITSDLTVSTDAIGVTVSTKTKSFLYPWAAVARVEMDVSPGVAKAGK